MPYILVIYDITDDNLRQKVADILHSYGLSRIQKSAFFGYLINARIKDLAAKLRKMIRNQRANIQIYVLCSQCLTRRIILGVPTVESNEYNKATTLPLNKAYVLEY
ncbi:MAG: CRISPR-associated endonuclease Cas2 [Crenarchaeota archaeon]|nr:CRISPR-associated endonuclease Cas2 [Thermoproteota archaeon]